VIDPALVPGVLFMNRKFRAQSPGLVDLAPTILNSLDVPKGAEMEGSDLLS
jgi:bisphosphoglycerate-independent phosphoglycerate mutase (AlkP superfamily)